MSSDNKLIAETAEEASDKTLAAVFDALANRQNFKLEAGAGAGKTYSLIEALKHILDHKELYLPRGDQRVACLTYTRVASDEIKARTDEHPSIFVDTLHGFLWEMIGPFQKALASALQASIAWEALLVERPDIEGLPINYDLGIRRIHEDRITLHHDDIPALAIELFKNKKFRSLIADRFPIIFIDEYQDTPLGLAQAMLSGQGDDARSPLIGFFGDHWQQIYDGTCGSIEHATVTAIPKNANFRSDRALVNFLNRLRPDLPQAPAADADSGTVTAYHTNEWTGRRLTHHWKGQISHEATQACLDWLRSSSPSSTWIQESTDLKILMLTHATIANELGYANLAAAFRHNDAFAKKEDPVIEYFVDTLEPALRAFRLRKYGDLFRLLGSKSPSLHSPVDKVRWTKLFTTLDSTSADATVGDMLDLLQEQRLFSLPTRVVKRERELREALAALGTDDDLREPHKLIEHQRFRGVAYAEVRALHSYLTDSTYFSTKHSVKGAEFDDVVVVVGRGWTKYDFAKMISAQAMHADPALKDSNSFVRSRNLFYVSASRAKHNLALLFVQELDDAALDTLSNWLGDENVVSVDLPDTIIPTSTVKKHRLSQ